MIRYSSLIIFLLLSFFQGKAQIPIGQWREHLPYNQATAIAEDGFDRVYCATQFSLFYYSRLDESINKMNSINSLSDIGVSSINFDKVSKTLFIGYANGNIDLLIDDKIYNISDLKRKQMIGSKRINSILFSDEMAYISTDFGVIVFDIKNREILDTYYIGIGGKALKVFKMLIDSQNIYAATNEGIYIANKNNSNLANYQNWHRDETINNYAAKFNQITVYKEQIIVNQAGNTYGTDTMYINNNGIWKHFKPFKNGPFTVLKAYNDTLIVGEEYGFTYFYNNLLDSFIVFNYNQGVNDNEMPMPRDIVVDNKGIVWIADKTRSLVRNPIAWSYQIIIPSGPESKNATAMSLENGKLLVASGGREPTGANLYINQGVYEFADEKWTSYNKRNNSVFDTISDVISVVVNPEKSNEMFVGTWGQGLIKMINGKVVASYNSNNSTLEQASNRPKFIGISGLCFDSDNNLWVVNTSTPNGLSMLSPKGVWKSYSLSPFVNEDLTGDIIIDDLNQKWIVLPRGNGILVYNDNFTLDNPWDDQKKLLNGSVGNGKLPSSEVFSIAKDLDGEIWVGTAKGGAVFYSPELIFSGHEFDAQQIYIDQAGISQYLLESEEVSAIAIDGANRKWFGTHNAGVFLMSADGSKLIHNFNIDNSPLLSNNIFSIAIDKISGEVFFATENGIISYRSDATAGSETNAAVKIFPNPVRPEYSGNIAISGLVANSSIKITDIAGNLIYETNANGGEALWNGKNYSGNRAATGVYLVFSTNEDGSQTKVAKILFIH